MASAQIAIQTLVASEPFQNRTQAAPEPRDIYWVNIALRGRERIIRGFFVQLALLFIVFLWGFPVGIIAGFTSIGTLGKYLPWLVEFSKDSVILRAILQGFLPTLAVTIFFGALPVLLDALSLVQGLYSRSAMEEATMKKYYFFLLFNNLLVFTVSSTIAKTLNILSHDPARIIEILAKTLPNVAPFFVNYVILQGIGLIPLQLLQIGGILMRFFNLFTANSPRQHADARAPVMIQYGWTYPPAALTFVIVLTYSIIQPWILIFGLVYFSIGYVVFKYQILYVYFHPYESAGRAWPLLFPRIITGMFIFQLTMTGIIVLRRAYGLGALMVPLLVITGLYTYLIELAYNKSSYFVPLEALHKELANISDQCTDVVMEQVEKVVPVAAPEVAPEPEPQKSHGFGGSLLHWKKSLKAAVAIEAQNKAGQLKQLILRRRRAKVLDDDDYEAEPDKYTDFRQQPMTLFDGILNTGMKRYSHPALTGVLPHLWLPMKSGGTVGQKAKNPDANSQVADVQTPIAVPQSATSIPTPVVTLSTSARSKFAGVKDASVKAASINFIPEEFFVEGGPSALPVDLANVDAVDDDLTDDEEREADPEGHHRTYYHHPESRISTLEAISSQPNSATPSYPTSRKASVASPFIPALSNLLSRSQNASGTTPTPSPPAIASIVSGTKKGSTPTASTSSTSSVVTTLQAAHPVNPAVDTTQTIVDSPTTTAATETPHGVLGTLADIVSPGGDLAKPFEERFSEFMGTRGAEEAARIVKTDIEQPAEGGSRRGSAVPPHVVENSATRLPVVKGATGDANERTGDAAK